MTGTMELSSSSGGPDSPDKDPPQFLNNSFHHTRGTAVSRLDDIGRQTQTNNQSDIIVRQTQTNKRCAARNKTSEEAEIFIVKERLISSEDPLIEVIDVEKDQNQNNSKERSLCLPSGRECSYVNIVGSDLLKAVQKKGPEIKLEPAKRKVEANRNTQVIQNRRRSKRQNSDICIEEDIGSIEEDIDAGKGINIHGYDHVSLVCLMWTIISH